MAEHKDNRSAGGAKKKGSDAPSPLHKKELEDSRATVRGAQLERYMERVLMQFRAEQAAAMAQAMGEGLQIYHNQRVAILEARIARLEAPFYVRWYNDMKARLVVTWLWLRIMLGIADQQEPAEPPAMSFSDLPPEEQQAAVEQARAMVADQ